MKRFAFSLSKMVDSIVILCIKFDKSVTGTYQVS